MRPRTLLIVGLAVAAFVAMLCVPPIRQPQSYHGFADARPWLGIPNFANVASNAAFLAVAWAGLFFLARKGGDFRAAWERWPWAAFFAGVVLVGVGSGYYHWAPSDATLFWDRLPMTIAFGSLFGIVVIERVGPRVGARLFVPIVAAAIAGALWWRHTGDLRFYALAQYFPLAAIPIMLLAYPPAYTRGGDFIVAGGGYVLAKVAELLDAPIYGVGGVVSGHTLKHLVAAAAIGWVLVMIRRRSVVPATRT